MSSRCPRALTGPAFQALEELSTTPHEARLGGAHRHAYHRSNLRQVISMHVMQDENLCLAWLHPREFLADAIELY
jgi:hypothetical protein